MLLRYILLLVLCYGTAAVQAQNEKTHWYFGRGAALSFEDGDPKVLSDNPLTDYTIASACMSDATTGDLLFYTNGVELRDGKHQVVKDNFKTYSTNVFELMVLEHPFIDGSYYLVVIKSPTSPVLEYYTVEVRPTGEVSVSERPVEVARGDYTGLSAVKNCRTGGYWLITYNTGTDQLLSFDVGVSIASVPVVSDANMAISQVGCITSNYTGELVAISEFAADFNQAQVYTYHVNKECGTFIMDQELNFDGAEYAYGLSFSENSQYLYATYSVGESDLVQFDLATGQPTLIMHSDFNYNELQMGPDGRIYISTHQGGIPGPRIDAINDPDKAGAACDYENNKLSLIDRNTSNFHFPNFLQDYSTETCERRKPSFEIENVCLGETIEVQKKTDFELPDSFYWVVAQDTFWQLTPRVGVQDLGDVAFSFVYLLCNDKEVIEYLVKVGEVRKLDLGSDTSICQGSSLQLDAGIGDDASYLWRHNASVDSTVTVSQPGQYWVQAGINGCYAQDSITIAFKSSVWVDLGGEHFLCEDDNDLVLLDAGKNFSTYQWLPTGDTTQWIQVAKVDTYYVIVEDYRGCKGEDHAAVSRRCQPFLFFPTAFSPNADGLNDVFVPVGQDVLNLKLQVYNLWGELIFESNDLKQGWDGTFKGHESPVGQYLWTCTYAGYKGKIHQQRFYKTGYLVLLE